MEDHLFAHLFCGKNLFFLCSWLDSSILLYDCYLSQGHGWLNYCIACIVLTSDLIKSWHFSCLCQYKKVIMRSGYTVRSSDCMGCTRDKRTVNHMLLLHVRKWLIKMGIMRRMTKSKVVAKGNEGGQNHPPLKRGKLHLLNISDPFLVSFVLFIVTPVSLIYHVFFPYIILFYLSNAAILLLIHLHICELWVVTAFILI